MLLKLPAPCEQDDEHAAGNAAVNLDHTVQGPINTWMSKCPARNFVAGGALHTCYYSFKTRHGVHPWRPDSPLTAGQCQLCYEHVQTASCHAQPARPSSSGGGAGDTRSTALACQQPQRNRAQHTATRTCVFAAGCGRKAMSTCGRSITARPGRQHRRVGGRVPAAWGRPGTAAAQPVREVDGRWAADATCASAAA
eukprot:356155-Chlamydomonas_euryale.AAC.6